MDTNEEKKPIAARFPLGLFYNLLGGVVFILIVGVNLATLILDLIYPLLDPRIHANRR